MSKPQSINSKGFLAYTDGVRTAKFAIETIELKSPGFRITAAGGLGRNALRALSRAKTVTVILIDPNGLHVFSAILSEGDFTRAAKQKANHITIVQDLELDKAYG